MKKAEKTMREFVFCRTGRKSRTSTGPGLIQTVFGKGAVMAKIERGNIGEKIVSEYPMNLIKHCAGQLFGFPLPSHLHDSIYSDLSRRPGKYGPIPRNPFAGSAQRNTYPAGPPMHPQM